MPLSLSQYKNKESGFTLIELMVVMAIIAILATAGLSAYTGYIKKARDTTRIADINAINKIVIANMSINGMPPQTTLAVYNAVKDANNGIALIDPLALNNWVTTKSVCFGSTTSITWKECSYTYRLCDGGMGYAVGTRFESAGNIKLYWEDNMPSCVAHASWNTNSIFEIGSCQISCYDTGVPAGCPTNNSSTLYMNTLPTKINSNGNAYNNWIVLSS